MSPFYKQQDQFFYAKYKYTQIELQEPQQLEREISFPGVKVPLYFFFSLN